MTRKLLSVLALFIALGASPALAFLTEEAETDRPGNDYTSFEARNALQCNQRCDQDESCRAYTFVFDPRINGRHLCFLKSAEGRPTWARNMTSGRKLITTEPNWDRRGQDYRRFPVDSFGGDLTCKQACLNDTRCRMYTYVDPQGVEIPPMCYLIETYGQRTRRAGVVGGYKMGDVP